MTSKRPTEVAVVAADNLTHFMVGPRFLDVGSKVVPLGSNLFRDFFRAVEAGGRSLGEIG